MLLTHGADIELKDKSQDTTLKAAARAGHVNIVNYLLSKVADLNTKGKSGSTPLTSATYAGYLGVIKALVKSGAAIKSNDSRWSLIHYAANYGHSEILDYYVTKGIDVDQ